MYLAARSWGVQPSEFWSMTICEFFLEYEHRRPAQPGDYAGSLTRGALDEIRADMQAQKKARMNVITPAQD